MLENFTSINVFKILIKFGYLKMKVFKIEQAVKTQYP